MSFKDAKKKNNTVKNDVKFNSNMNTVSKMEDIPASETYATQVVHEPIKEAEDNIAKEKDSNEPKKKIPQIAKVIRPLVNVRKGASIDSEVLIAVSENAEFKVLEEKNTNNFVCIKVNGEVGFIKKDLVQVFDNPAYLAHTVTAI